MPPPKNLKELRGLIGRLQFIRRFISQHSQRCRPFYELLKRGALFEWNDKCQQAFDGLKRYLSSPPVLKPPIPGKPLILYVSVIDNSVLSLQIIQRSRKEVHGHGKDLCGSGMGISEAQALLSRSRGTAHSKDGSNQVLAGKACADGMLSQMANLPKSI